MDNFDDFEIKPLTEGLGFHKKSIKLEDKIKSSDLVKEAVGPELPEVPPQEVLETASQESQELNDLMAALDKVTAGIEAENNPTTQTRLEDKTLTVEAEVKITQPLARKYETQPTQQPGMDWPQPQERAPAIEEKPAQPSVYDIFQEQAPLRNVDLDESTSVRRGAADSPMRALKPVPFSVISTVLDSMVVLAFSLIFLISLLVVTGIDLGVVFAGAKSDLMTQLSLAMLYVAVMQMYVVIGRSFFGSTLGEWTFDLQLGDEKQIKSPYYPVLVVWRGIVTLITGVITLPILSLITRRDLASYLTGLQLYKHN